jgi:adenosylhomocysteine nucleosidase
MKYRNLLQNLALLVLLCLTGCKQEHEKTPAPIAILGAFTDEIHMLEDSLTPKQTVRIDSIEFVRGTLKGKDVVMTYTGIGKVNAAMTTTILVSHFHPSKVIFTGIAGGLNPDLKPADIVIARKCVQHDLNYIYDDSLASYQISNPMTGKTDPVFYESDTQLLHLAEKKLLHIKLEPYEATGRTYYPKIMTGIIATGDAFIASKAKKAEIINRFHADAVEMEGAAVAQVCYQFKIPFLIIRSISDSADKNADMDIGKFLKTASDNANILVIQLIESLK